MTHPTHRFLPVMHDGRPSIQLALLRSEWPNEEHITRVATIVRERVGDGLGPSPHQAVCHALEHMVQDGTIVHEAGVWFCLGQPLQPAPEAGPCQDRPS